MSHMKSGKR